MATFSSLLLVVNHEAADFGLLPLVFVPDFFDGTTAPTTPVKCPTDDGVNVLVAINLRGK